MFGIFDEKYFSLVSNGFNVDYYYTTMLKFYYAKAI